MDPGHNDHTITTAGIRTGPRSPPQPRPDPVQLDAITPNTPAKAGGHRQLGAGLGGAGWNGEGGGMTSAAQSPYAGGYRFPAEVISHAVWLYFRFPLSLRMVEEMLAARGIEVSHEIVRQ